MKKVLTLAFAVVNVTFAQSSLPAGTYSLGGDIAIHSAFSKDDGYERDEMSVIFDPSITYFLIDQLAFEVNPVLQLNIDRYSFSDSYYNDSWEYRSIMMGIAGGARYYVDMQKVSPFAGFEFGVLWANSEPEKFEFSKLGTPHVLVGAKAGAAIFLSTSAALEPKLRLNYQTIGDYKQFDVYAGVGVSYFIKK